MIQKSAKDFWIWLVLFVTTITTLIFAWPKWHNDYSDNTGITAIIIILFLIALSINFLNTLSIFSDFSKIETSEGLFYEHITNLENAAQGKLSISQDFSLTIIENRLLRQESWVQLFANLLITLGMIGTVVGLTLSMKGLSQAMDSIKSVISDGSSGNITNPTVGLGEALSGMSSAFITTLAGAALGGFFLKLLSHATTNLIEDLIDQIRYKAEIEKIPILQKIIWQKDVNDLSTAYQDMRRFIQSSREIDDSLKDYTKRMSDASRNINSIANMMNRDILSLQKSSQVETQKRLETLLLGLTNIIEGWRILFIRVIILIFSLFVILITMSFIVKR